MIKEHITYLFLIFTLFVTILAQENVGDACQMSKTGAPGICKLAENCPRAQELADKGIGPTICGIPSLTNTYIFCCEDAYNTVNDAPTPNENFILSNANVKNKVLPNIYRSKSEEKCIEYAKSVMTVFNVARLTPHLDQTVSVQVEKCENAGLSLIVGGAPASAGEFPFMAAVGYNGDTKIEWSCGGTLISDYYVVTAAHCAETNFYGPPVKVRLGDVYLKSDDDYSIYVDYDIANITVHEEYVPPIRYNDIALIRLASQVEFTQFIRPACLWSKTQLDTTKTIATGWGTKGPGEDKSNKLLKVELNIYENYVCSKTFPPNTRRLPEGILQTMLCAGDLDGPNDTCQGDSGGPLIVQREKNRCIFHIVGITSFGKKCGGHVPAVYTRISEYVPWIEKLIW